MCNWGCKKKLETASKHREKQNEINADTGKKRKVAFEKLSKTVKKQKTIIII